MSRGSLGRSTASVEGEGGKGTRRSGNLKRVLEGGGGVVVRQYGGRVGWLWEGWLWVDRHDWARSALRGR